jgi:hypothetical protein
VERRRKEAKRRDTECAEIRRRDRNRFRGKGAACPPRIASGLPSRLPSSLPSGLRVNRESGVNIGNGSRSSYRLSTVFLITELVFERDWRKLKDFKGLGEC